MSEVKIFIPIVMFNVHVMCMHKNNTIAYFILYLFCRNLSEHFSHYKPPNFKFESFYI